MKPVFYALTAAMICLSATSASANHGKPHYTKTTQVQTSQYQLTNKDVTRLQRSLTDKGYYNGPIDGLWGPSTTQAVQSYQAANSLQTSGSLNMMDLQNLGIRIDETTYDNNVVYETKGKTIYNKNGQPVYTKDGAVVYDANGNVVYATTEYDVKHGKKYHNGKTDSSDSAVNYDNRTSNRLNRNQTMNVNN